MWAVVYSVMKRLLDQIIASQHIQLEHIHSAQKTYPTMANSIVLTTGSGTAWTAGNFIEVVPANGITSPFDIHWISIGSVSLVGGTYYIELYSGAIGLEVSIGQCRAYRQANQAGAAPSPMTTAIQSANTRISAKVACSDATAETIGIALFYHTY